MQNFDCQEPTSNTCIGDKNLEMNFANTGNVCNTLAIRTSDQNNHGSDTLELQLLGHLQRSAEQLVVKTARKLYISGKRSHVRPKKQSIDQISEDAAKYQDRRCK